MAKITDKTRLKCDNKNVTNKNIEILRQNKTNFIITILILLPIGYSYMHHIENLFENDKYFSHLSTLERELSFRTESGLYYYYFKLLVSKQKVLIGNKFNNRDSSNIRYKYEYNNENIFKNIQDNIINDNRTEYPNTINALERFNLYPELLTAILYRLFHDNNFFSNADCFTIDRGENVSPIESCSGFVQPIYFYSKVVFILHGFSFAFLFLLCWLLNDYSILAGLTGCLCYIFNHSEATRVMWSPALRESFAYPFHVLQLLLVTRELKEKLLCKSYIPLVITNVFYLLTWQFAQFAIGTQASSIYFTYILGYISREKLINLISIHSISLILCFIFMFFNKMLLASFFSSILISIWILILFDYLFKNFMKLSIKIQIIFTTFQIISFFILIICVKKFLLPLLCFINNDDTHIWDILKSKFSQFFGKEFHTFDTRLYLCAKEFDFLEFETIIKLSKTLLLPVVIFNLIYIVLKLIRIKIKNQIEEGDEVKSYGHIVYNILQLGAFSLMAGLIMRLKLFWTPNLCVIFTLIFNESFSLFNKLKIPLKYSIIAVLIAIMSIEGVNNLKKQYEILGEYNDYPMENLINWINLNTPSKSSFAGSMPTMANVKLSTNRAIMNHPHYENNDLRQRVRMLYSYLYGYNDIKLLHDLLKNKYRIDYLVLESYYCLSHQPGKPECAMSQIAHLNDNKTTKRTQHQSCFLLVSDNDSNAKKLFKKVFEIQHISVYKIL
jgi:hypothetical protein